MKLTEYEYIKATSLENCEQIYFSAKRSNATLNDKDNAVIYGSVIRGRLVAYKNT